ncbi:PaaI family thioesterase [Bacillus niameyensis]|uniref:PaaI family thioesterase n=1 Tax=Bacillus niameyensis TaxID=1522308 RepID=UPI0007807146|nr:PaaI family thioesterase [Bacillus niameyensis]
MNISYERLEELLVVSKYHQFLGLSLESVEDGYVKIKLPFKEEFLADENDSYIHGGIISSLIDVAGDFALITKVGKGIPTIDLRVDYLRAARKENLVAEAKVVKCGRTLGVSDVVVRNEAGKEIAIGRGVYSTA